MLDIRDHGGAFGGQSANLPSNFAAVSVGYDSKVTQVDMSGDIYGKNRGRYSSYPTYYHNNKNGTSVKTKYEANESIVGWEKTGYYKISGMTVTKYNHSDQVIETFTVPGTSQTVRNAIKLNNFWVIQTYASFQHTINVYNSAGSLISSYGGFNNNDASLQINPFGIAVFESFTSTTSGGQQAVYLGAIVVGKAGNIVTATPFGVYTFESDKSLSAVLAAIAQWKLAFLYNK